MERPPRYRTIHHEKIGTGEGGGSLEKVVECNGIRHRMCIDEVVYDESGEIEYVDPKECNDIGPCDGQHE